MKIESDVKLDFVDVLIKPKRSEAASRASVVLDKFFKFKFSQEGTGSYESISGQAKPGMGTLDFESFTSKYPDYHLLSCSGVMATGTAIFIPPTTRTAVSG